MKIIMIGATGYIGSAVATTLVEARHDVSAIVHSGGVPPGVQAITGSIEAPDELAATIARQSPDAVVWTGTTNRADLDTRAVSAILAQLGTGTAFVYTSGAWVHGETGDNTVDETAPLHPIELVAWRVAVEERVLATPGIRGIVIRPGIVYGHGGGIPAMLSSSARNEGAARYVGDGHNRWPLVFIEDLADLYRRAVEDAPAGTVLLGVAPSSVTVLDVARAASEGVGAGGRTTSWPLEAAREELGAFADALALDQARLSGQRAESLLGWNPHGPSIVDELRSGSYARAL